MDEVVEQLLKAVFEAGLNRGAKRVMPPIVVEVAWSNFKADLPIDIVNVRLMRTENAS